MIIYKITNRINGKIYIGQTINSLKQRWFRHCCDKKACCKALYNAIQKYGKENFTIEQIDIAYDRDELDSKEVFWISFYDSMNRNKGYNLLSGGNKNHNVSDETRKRMSESHLGLKGVSRFGKDNPNYGNKWTDEQKRKMGETRKGKYGGAKNPAAKTVVCIETGIMFGCITEAAISVNKTRSNLKDHLYGRTKTCGGYHWRFVDEKS